MSYILDALRRSQAERERGQVPSLHAQASPLAPASSTALTRSWLWPGLAGLGLVLMGALVWVSVRPGASAPSQPAAAVAPVVAALPRPEAAPSVLPPPAPLPVTPAAVTAPAPQPLPVVVSAPVVPVPALVARPASASVLPQPQDKPQPQLQPQPQSLSLAQLSTEQRRELPPLVLGGSIWSDSAANRFVIFNGQLVHEGETAAPGVTVERIGPKAAWLRWRELRIEWPL
jgi:general secretion pathway protein B